MTTKTKRKKATKLKNIEETPILEEMNEKPKNKEEILVTGEEDSSNDEIFLAPDEGKVVLDRSRADSDLSKLPGIGPATRKRMIEAGFTSTKRIAVATTKEIMNVPGVGETTATRAIKAAREMHDLGMRRGDAIAKLQKNRKRITTGSSAFDELLGGGIETGSLTEFFGEYRSGKTQTCFTLAVTVQLPRERGGLGKCVAWIDTEGTWRSDRIEAIAKAHGLDPAKALNNILYWHAHNSEEQRAQTEEALGLIEQENIGLIIIDSLIAHFRSEFIGRGTLANRQQLISSYLAMVNKTIEYSKVAAVMTNQVQSKPDMMFGDANLPTGGNVVAHGTTHRLKFRKGKGDERKVEIVDSPALQSAKASFLITTGGITDVKGSSKKVSSAEEDF